MMEDHLRVQMAADAFGELKLPVGEHLYHVVDLVRVGHVVHQSLVYGAEVVYLLEHARGYERRLEDLFSVHCRVHSLEHAPFRVGELERRDLNVVLPVFYVLYEYLVRSVDREASRNVLGEVVGYSPEVDHLRAALLRVWKQTFGYNLAS